MKKFKTSALIACSSFLILSCTGNNNTDSTTKTPQGQSQSTPQETVDMQNTPAPAPAPQQEIANTAPVASIPPFTFYKVKSGISFNNEDIAKGKNTVFILFDPSCGHCQQEAGELSKNYDKIKDINLYFVSMNDPALMVTFLKTFGPDLEGKENVEMLYDKNQEFIRKFHIPDQFPANYVYGSDGQIKEYWDGAKKTDEIIAAYLK